MLYVFCYVPVHLATCF